MDKAQKIKTIDSEGKLIVNNTEEKQEYLIPDNSHVSITIVGSAKITNVGNAKISLQSSLSKELDLKLRGLVFYNLANSTFFRTELKKMLEKKAHRLRGALFGRNMGGFL